VINHPQILANEIVAEFDHPRAGSLRQARPAPLFSETPTIYRRGAPALGEHSHEALSEAGLSQEEIEELAAVGIVVTEQDRPV